MRKSRVCVQNITKSLHAASSLLHSPILSRWLTQLQHPCFTLPGTSPSLSHQGLCPFKQGSLCPSVINDDSFPKRRRACRMGWPTAFDSKAFWLIYAGHFFPAHFSIRGVSQAQMHVHNIVRAAASLSSVWWHTHRHIQTVGTGLQALTVMWISFYTFNWISWFRVRFLCYLGILSVTKNTTRQ